VDGCGERYKRRRLAVLELSLQLGTAFMRHIDPDDVVEVLAPPASFLRVFFDSTLPDAQTCAELSAYGGLSDHYIQKFVDEHGNVRKNWRDYR
jgi:hypothetical protein